MHTNVIYEINEMGNIGVAQVTGWHIRQLSCSIKMTCVLYTYTYSCMIGVAHASYILQFYLHKLQVPMLELNKINSQKSIAISAHKNKSLSS